MADLSDLIAQLRAAAEDATKGEWKSEYDNDTGPADDCFREFYQITAGKAVGEAVRATDAAYIVAAQPQNITRILDAYAEMEREAERLRDAIRTGVAYIAAKRPNDAADCMTRALQQKDKADA